jgi:hypothetical protein
MWSWTQVGNTKESTSVEEEGRKEGRTMSNTVNHVTATEIFRG